MVEHMSNINELLVKELQSKARELEAYKKMQMQLVIIDNERSAQADLKAEIAEAKMKLDQAKAKEIEG